MIISHWHEEHVRIQEKNKSKETHMVDNWKSI